MPGSGGASGVLPWNTIGTKKSGVRSWDEVAVEVKKVFQNI